MAIPRVFCLFLALSLSLPWSWDFSTFSGWCPWAVGQGKSWQSHICHPWHFPSSRNSTYCWHVQLFLVQLVAFLKISIG